MTLRVLDLFSGIGGFSLGLERAGMRTVAFCEIDPYCRAVLRKHWPGVPIWSDIKKLRDFDGVDVICGGFPCQDISEAGLGAGLAGARSGLWKEFARLIGKLRPRYAIVENVAAINFRGLLDVLGDLAEIGFDAEWNCIPACAVGAPHQRDRTWIVAYPSGEPARPTLRFDGICKADCRWPHQASPSGGCCDRCGRRDWSPEPTMGRVVDGTSDIVDQLEPLGNAVVPQIPEIIGRAILEAERQRFVVS